VDYTDKIPDNGGLFPSGLVEIARHKDIIGKTAWVENQYNFALYAVLAKSPDDDESASINAEWVMDFQEWVQEMSMRGQAPIFGDEPRRETIQAQNGTLIAADDEGTAVYVVQISVNFIKNFNN
jgi:hypothetical protein